MRAALQNRINPPKAQTGGRDFSDAEIKSPTNKVSGIQDKTDFKTLLQNSNEEVQKERGIL